MESPSLQMQSIAFVDVNREVIILSEKNNWYWLKNWLKPGVFQPRLSAKFCGFGGLVYHISQKSYCKCAKDVFMRSLLAGGTICTTNKGIVAGQTVYL